MPVGAAFLGGADLVWQLWKIYNSPQPPAGFLDAFCRINFIELGLFIAAGAALGAFPDILEPATNNPNHRAFFHSVACGGAMLYGAFGKHTQKWHPNDRFAARAMVLSYLTHLYLDSGTSKGLPLI